MTEPSFNVQLWLGQRGAPPAGQALTTEAATWIEQTLSAHAPGERKVLLANVVAGLLATLAPDPLDEEVGPHWSAEDLLTVAAAVWKKTPPANRATMRDQVVAEALANIVALNRLRASLSVDRLPPEPPAARPSAILAEPPLTASPARPSPPNGEALTGAAATTRPSPDPNPNPQHHDPTASVDRALAALRVAGPRPRRRCEGCGETAARCLCLPAAPLQARAAAARAVKEASPAPSRRGRRQDDDDDEEEEEEEEEEAQEDPDEPAPPKTAGFLQGGRVTQKSADTARETMEALLAVPWADSAVIWAPRVWQLRLARFPAQRWELELALSDLALRTPKGRKISSTLLRQLALDSLLLWSRVAGPAPDEEVMALALRNLDEIGAAIFWDEGASREQVATFRAELSNTDKPKRYRRAFGTRKGRK